MHSQKHVPTDNRGMTIYAGKIAVAPTYSLRMETVADILDGKIIIHCHSYRADEILMLMDVCKDFGVSKLVFQHVNEGFKVAPELADFWRRSICFFGLVGIQI